MKAKITRKATKTLARKPSFRASYFHCSTLGRICQYFFAFLCVLASITSINSPSAAALSNEIAATSSVGSLYFTDFEADYYLTRAADGLANLHVVEQITAIFPSSDENHGISRVIPFTAAGGKQLTTASPRSLRIDVKRNGSPEKVSKINVGDGFFEVFIGDASEYVHGKQVYTLTYDFQNVITNQSEGEKSWQELYWDTNGNDWAYNFSSVTARVHLDNEISSAFDGRTACYVGRYGDNGSERCRTSKLDDGYEFHAESLSRYENLTYVLGFDADTFVVETRPLSLLPLAPIIVNTILAVVTFVLIIYAKSSLRLKKDYYKNLPQVVEYIPPSGYTVLEAAASYIGRKPYLKNKETAGLLELAVTHKVELIKNENAKSGLFSSEAPWRIRIKSLDLTREQRDILNLLSPEAINLSVDQEITIKTLSPTDALLRGRTYRDDLTKTMLDKGLYTGTFNPSTHRITTSGPTKLIPALAVAWIIYLMVSAMAIGFLEDYLDTSSAWPIISPDASIFISMMIAFFMPFFISISSGSYQKFALRTEKALDLSRYLEGLYTYMVMAEADRLKMLQSVDGADTTPQGIVKLYERLLPYAALFGLEKSWLAELGRYYEMSETSNPSWYHSAAVFSAADFAKTISSGTSYVSTASYSHSNSSGSSSGGSGFSGGGGHSGGGGGGGGGGGW